MLRNWVRGAIKHELSDVAYTSSHIDKNLRIITYRKNLEALTRKDDFYGGLCDELVRMHKQYLNYKELK